MHSVPLDPFAVSRVITRVTVQDRIYESLRAALMSGSFDPGEVLTVATVSKSFGTSPMPVREALRRLGAERALEVKANGSARVPMVTRARLADLCNARILNEGIATELAADEVSNRDIERLERLVEEHEAAVRHGDIREILLRNQAFHFQLYRFSKSEVLLQLIEILWLRFGPYMRLVSRHVTPSAARRKTPDSESYHLHIVRALKARDRAVARAMIEADIGATRDFLAPYCPQETEI